MPLTGEYAPSAFDVARDHVELYERSGGTEGTAHPTGERVIVLTSVGAKSGNLRKTPLMRVEHDGQYAVVAALGGAPKHPVWYYNLIAAEVERARLIFPGERHVSTFQSVGWLAGWPGPAACCRSGYRL